jgi:hypothetical protein
MASLRSTVTIALVSLGTALAIAPVRAQANADKPHPLTRSQPAIATPPVIDNPLLALDGNLRPLRWLFLPIIGFPLLVWLMKNRDTESDLVINHQTAIVCSRNQLVTVHQDAGTHHPILGSLQNGQSILLSGRQREKWSELAQGGWVPSQYVQKAMVETTNAEVQMLRIKR